MKLEEPKQRKIYFSNQVTQDSIRDVVKEITEINEHDRFLERLYAVYDLEYKAKPIEILIDSYGGHVYQIFGLLSIIEKSVTPVHTIATGAAMSCGFMLLISGHKRFAYPLATPMYHQISSVAWGKVEDMKQDLAETERLQSLIEEITIRKTKISKDKLEDNRIKKIDWFMTAEEALKLGVIDEIIN